MGRGAGPLGELSRLAAGRRSAKAATAFVIDPAAERAGHRPEAGASGSTRAACSTASRSTVVAASGPTSARSPWRSTARRRRTACACWSSAAPTFCRASRRRGCCSRRAPSGRGRLATQLHQHVQLAGLDLGATPGGGPFPRADRRAGAARGALDRQRARRRPAPSWLVVPGWHVDAPRAARRARAFAPCACSSGAPIAQAARIIVPSRVTAEELARTLHVPRAKITVIPLAAAARFTPSASPNDAAVRARLRLPERYLLHTGGSDARKRLPELVDVFAALAKDDPDLALVLVGPVAGGDGHPGRAPRDRSSGARQRILLAGVLPESDLPAVYRGAAALVLATRHEGFGLPVVEAFASGVPGGRDGRRRGARGRRRRGAARPRGRGRRAARRSASRAATKPISPRRSRGRARARRAVPLERRRRGNAGGLRGGQRPAPAYYLTRRALTAPREAS